MAKEDKLTVFEQMVMRQIDYNEQTLEIFKSMKKVCRVIEERIKEDTVFAEGEIEWNDISMRAGDDETVFIDLEIVFPIGASILTGSGKHVTITEDLEQYFNKEVVVGVPLSITELTSMKEIRAAMANKSDVNKPPAPQQPEDATSGGQLSDRDAKAILLQARNPTGVKH